MSGNVPGEATIFEVLGRQHREIEARFARLHALGSENLDEARFEFAHLADLLTTHLRAESEIVFPTLGRLDELCDDVAAAVGDHDRLLRSMDELRIARWTPSEWFRAVRRLEAEIEHHIETTECEMFPIAKRVLTADEALHLAHAFSDFGYAGAVSAPPAH